MSENFVDYSVCNQNHKTMTEKIDNIINSLGDINVKIAELPEKVLDKADERYASKTVERAVYGIIGALSLTVIIAIVELVIKK